MIFHWNIECAAKEKPWHLERKFYVFTRLKILNVRKNHFLYTRIDEYNQNSKK